MELMSKMLGARTTLAYFTATLLLAALPVETMAGNTPAAPHTKQHKANSKGFWNTLSRRWLTREQIELLNLAHRIGMDEDGEIP